MNNITFIDTELNPTTNQVEDIGAYREPEGQFHANGIYAFMKFLAGSEYICGHNIIQHDLKAIRKEVEAACPQVKYIDTLYLAPLLFPSRPYHSLVKDDKLMSDELNNPLNDAIKARELFYDEVNAFRSLNSGFQSILFGLLGRMPEFEAFFEFMDFNSPVESLVGNINYFFHDRICTNIHLDEVISKHPAELAYCLALINAHDQYSIVPRWLNYSRPEIVQVMRQLRSKRCFSGCPYCDQANDAHTGLKTFFGYEKFREFGGEPLQEMAVNAALRYESLLTVFPTGGGKSITFQVPALMQGMQNKGLTVVISPLQSLMKDQVDNLEKVGITSAVTINGLQDPIERSKSIERVYDGQSHILYISPESLRSPSIEKLILGRSINRFVIDEAHCFSSWGQDFRVDYLYIGDFIKNIQEKRQQEPIPVSCFTATAKPQVVEDICQYFKEKLDLTLTIFQSRESRKNLQYTVYEQTDDSKKYTALRDILNDGEVPAIVYVSRTKKAEDIAAKLSQDGLSARPYHGKLDSKVKTDNQESFLNGEFNIMVATTAFGMGVDKRDIQKVVHYDISDSLENYVQEAGRAGRDEKLEAKCYILYDEEDLNKHFILQNQTRLTQKEINQIWKAVKDLTKTRQTISKSALEIARKAGWDETVSEVETRVKTAIAALEQAQYLKRKNNQSRVFADSLQYKTAQAAIDRINVSDAFTAAEKEYAIRIVKSLISSKRTSSVKDEEGEARVEYLAEKLGIALPDVIRVITLLRQEKLLADARDLSAFINKSHTESKLINGVNQHAAILTHLLQDMESGQGVLRLKELRENILDSSGHDVTVKQIRTIIHFLAIKNWISFVYRGMDKDIVSLQLVDTMHSLRHKTEKILAIAPFIGRLLIEKANSKENATDPALIDFSVLEICDALVKSGDIQFQEVTREEVEDAIFYLTRIEALTIEGGFLVIYQRIMVERLEDNYRIQYKATDYENLERFYQNKIQQVHIVGEYARKMVDDYTGALQFVDDYFKLNYSSFLNKHFQGRREIITKTLTPRKFQELIGTLSPAQLSIVKDESKYTAVLAGPGSGKTKVLIHKLASASLIENLKHEQILMLTFSRSAVTEFKRRLYKMIGNAAAFIQIKTFHSYCFDLLGQIGDLSESKEIIKKAVQSIREEKVEAIRLTKLLMLIDEAQDVNEDEYELIKELIKQNEGMRVILVGDDDQNIFEFRGSSSKYLQKFSKTPEVSKYELLENYRSEQSIVGFANRFLTTIRNRLKTTPLVAVSNNEGEVTIIESNSGQLSMGIADILAKTPLSGSTGVLCQSNQEAVEINSILLQQQIPARLIQDNKGFSLSNLFEIRAFVEMIQSENVITLSKDKWNEAKRKCKLLFMKSHWWEMMQRFWSDFEESNKKGMYVSDLLAFVNESKLEDFIYGSTEIVLVSTYHKAKGREFDNVFITVSRQPVKEDDKRALYVAMTRAKHKLVILANGSFLKRISDGFYYSINNTLYGRSSALICHLTHEDVNLGYVASVQKQIDALTSGEILQVNEDGCKDKSGSFVVRFSSKFQKTIANHQKAGYSLRGSGKVNFIVWWKMEDGKEVKVVLPEVELRRKG